jgi:hypothetical protein
LLGGGTAPGEVIGLIAPFGRGKTTLAVQCFCEWALGKHHGLYITYEQPFKPDLLNRVYGYLGGLSRTDIANPKGLTPEQDSKLKENLAPIHPYLHVVDMVTNRGGAGGGCSALSAHLNSFERKGIHIEFVILDQYLPFVRELMNAKGISEEELRKVMEATIYDFMKLAAPNKHDCTFLILHQTTTEGAANPPTTRPKSTDSAECRSLPFWLSTFLQLGTQDEKGCQWCVSGKGRATKRDELIVQMDGEHYKYKWELDRFRVSGHSFHDTKAESEDHKIKSVSDVDSDYGKMEGDIGGYA